MTAFKTIIADPPVPFAGWVPGAAYSRSAESHYKTMTWQDLADLGPLVNAVAAEDCALFMWLCQPLLVETMDMVKAWGFTYKTKAFSWCKTYPQKGGFFIGMGYWTRANTEDVLLFTRGQPGRRSKGVAQLLATLEQSPYEAPAVIAPNTRHSRKPEAVQDRIEALVDGPYLELFARRSRPGWTCLGNEVDGLDIRESLQRLAQAEPLPVVRKYEAEQSSLDLEAA